MVARPSAWSLPMPFDRAAVVMEPGVTPDTFATELVACHRLGGNLRLTFAVQQRMFDGTPDGTPERVVVAKLVLPADAVQESLLTIARALDGPPDQPAPRPRKNLTLVN
jgi:hypothetical protein